NRGRRILALFARTSVPKPKLEIRHEAGSPATPCGHPARARRGSVGPRRRLPPFDPVMMTAALLYPIAAAFIPRTVLPRPVASASRRGCDAVEAPRRALHFRPLAGCDQLRNSPAVRREAEGEWSR